MNLVRSLRGAVHRSTGELVAFALACHVASHEMGFVRAGVIATAVLSKLRAMLAEN